MRKRLIICYLVFVANLNFLRNTINGYRTAFLAFAATIKTKSNNSEEKYSFFHESNI